MMRRLMLSPNKHTHTHRASLRRRIEAATFAFSWKKGIIIFVLFFQVLFQTQTDHRLWPSLLSIGNSNSSSSSRKQRSVWAYQLTGQVDCPFLLLATSRLPAKTPPPARPTAAAAVTPTKYLLAISFIRIISLNIKFSLLFTAFSLSLLFHFLFMISVVVGSLAKI